MFLLHIDTTTDICSVAVSQNNKLIDCLEDTNDRKHANILTIFIEQILKNNNISLAQVSGIVISEGPGSYTGLRIGSSTAKGLCYSLNIPLIAINTLKALSFMAIKANNNTNALYAPMIDARRMEVYSALYTQQQLEILPVKATIVDEYLFKDFIEQQTVYFFGNGALKCITILNHKNFVFIDKVYSSAKNLIELGYAAYLNQQFSDIAYFEPNYIKNFEPNIYKKLILN